MGDIVKSGNLQLQVKSLLRNNWADKFCILYGRSANSHPYMDFYDSKEAFQSHKKSGKKCDKVIDLQHLKAIKISSQRTSHGQEHLIEMHIRRSKHFLMLKNENDLRDWSTKLNNFVSMTEGEGSSSGLGDPEPDYSDDDDDDCDLSTVNMMYESSDSASRFEVEVQEGDLATLYGIVGKRTLLVSNSELAFEDPVTRNVQCNFSFQWLRRYGKTSKSIFNFEVGRKCPNGPGKVEVRTLASKEIHQLVNKHSKNTSTTKTPPPPKWMSDKNESPPEQPKVDRSGIGGPVFVANSGRKHPGTMNVPSLVPLSVAKPERNSHSPTTPPPFEVNLRDSQTDKNNDLTSSKFKKELECKLHDDGSKKNSVKDGSKKSKEDKKEKNKKEKESEKEKEKREKESEKEKKIKEKEKKSKFSLFSSKKEKEKEKDVEKVEKVQESNTKWHGGNFYEEPDLLPYQSKSKPMPTPKLNEALYDVADVPVEPKEKSSGFECEPECVYDEAISCTRDTGPVLSAPVVYAKPVIGNSKAPTAEVYSDARDVEKSANAWKQFARKEDEEHHMENYSSIKDARDMLKQPPPIPKRNYDEEEDDDTYDRTNFVTSSRQERHTENLYGTASGLVGNVVSVPSANKDSDSEGEDLYDNPEEEAYETAGNQSRRPVIGAYEEAEVNTVSRKSKSSPPYPPNDTLYEEIR